MIYFSEALGFTQFEVPPGPTLLRFFTGWVWQYSHALTPRRLQRRGIQSESNGTSVNKISFPGDALQFGTTTAFGRVCSNFLVAFAMIPFKGEVRGTPPPTEQKESCVFLWCLHSSLIAIPTVCSSVVMSLLVSRFCSVGFHGALFCWRFALFRVSFPFTGPLLPFQYLV